MRVLKQHPHLTFPSSGRPIDKLLRRLPHKDHTTPV